VLGTDLGNREMPPNSSQAQPQDDDGCLSVLSHWMQHFRGMGSMCWLKQQCLVKNWKQQIKYTTMRKWLIAIKPQDETCND